MAVNAGKSKSFEEIYYKSIPQKQICLEPKDCYSQNEQWLNRPGAKILIEDHSSEISIPNKSLTTISLW